MGYTTEFTGAFALSHPLTVAQYNYLKKFAQTRRVTRDAQKSASLDDELRVEVGLPIGQDGEYYVGAGGFMGQYQDSSVVDWDSPPGEQPGLWCQWEPSICGKYIQWDGGEKFYHYVEWIEYIIKHFLEPWGVSLNGSVGWQGEDRKDVGIIKIENNKVTVSGDV